MASHQWDPLRELITLRDTMHALLEDGCGRPRVSVGPDGVPVDVKETDDAFVVQVALPGVEPVDVDISVLGSTLRISGEFKDREPAGTRWLVRERRFGPFVRTINLPTAVSPERAAAEFHNGILTIHLPKVAAARPKTIPVRAGSAG
ncbi:MAG: Hsp20/alpha crystallin family protein [Sphaerobacter sp.]|nr:Hsp20/alpha crystallin family protein [Sphaerobacter sp.]